MKAKPEKNVSTEMFLPSDPFCKIGYFQDTVCHFYQSCIII